MRAEHPIHPMRIVHPIHPMRIVHPIHPMCMEHELLRYQGQYFQHESDTRTVLFSHTQYFPHTLTINFSGIFSKGVILAQSSSITPNPFHVH